MCLAWFRCVRNSYWILSFGKHRNIRIHRSAGVLEYRSTGVLEYWSTGVPEYWSTGVLEYRSTGVPEYRSTGVLEYWSTGVPECRNTGILSPESRKSSIPTFWKPLHFCSLLRGFNYSSVPGFRCFNYSGVQLLRGRNTLEHWRVPNAELSRILRRH